MKLAKEAWLRAGRKMAARMMAALLGIALSQVGSAQAVSTTTVQGTVYLANGAPGSGTLRVSWPTFTTAAGQVVAAASTTVQIAPDGFLSVQLAPNEGATPAGQYYTAVFYLSDGTVSTQYWVVPAAAQATLAQVQAQVMPAAQAVKAVSKAYVDQSIAELTQSLLTASGGDLSGPLFLNGDPTQPLQAADKHYVDATANAAAAAAWPAQVLRADQFAGADFGAKVQACVNAVDANYGGTCDARNFTGNLSMASNLTIATGNTTLLLPCATITTANQIVVTAGTRNVALHGCALRGGSAASGSQGGTVFAYTGTGAMVQVGDPTYAVDTPGFHMDNAVINTTGATSATAQGLAAYRTQEMDLESLYLLGNANQVGMALDGTGNYTGGTFLDDEFGGFQTAINAIGHQAANPATTDWVNASTFVRLHIDCPTSNGNPIAGTYGINLQQGDGNTFTGGDVEGCATALHLGANAQNNTIVGLRNENSNNQVVADAGSAYNNWMTGGTMFTGKLVDNGTRNSFLDTFHRSFNGLNGDWYGSQQDATVTNHYRLGTGAGNERGLLDRYQTDYGYRWTMGLSDATAGEQFYQVLDELNSVYRISVGQYNSGQASTNNQTVINAAGTGAVVLNGSKNAGTGGVIFGAGGPSGTTVATIGNTGNAQFNGTLQVGGTTQSAGTMTVRNNADAEVDYYLWPGLTASQKGSFTYKDWNGNSQWYLVKDASNNWALNSAVGGLDSFKAYQSTNSGDTYINASNAAGHIRLNYESGSGAETDIYSGSSSSLAAAFLGPTAIKFPGLAAGSGKSCLQIDTSGYITNTGSACGTSSGVGSGTVGTGYAGQIAYYTANGTSIGGMNAVPVTAGGTGASTAAAALNNLGALSVNGGTLTGPLGGTSASFSDTLSAATTAPGMVLNANICATGGATWCSGSDLGAWINAAFAQCGSNTCTVQVAPATWTTPINQAGQSGHNLYFSLPGDYYPPANNVVGSNETISAVSSKVVLHSPASSTTPLWLTSPGWGTISGTSSASNVTFSNFTMDGNLTNNAASCTTTYACANGIVINSTPTTAPSNITIDGVYFQNFAGLPIFIETGVNAVSGGTLGWPLASWVTIKNTTSNGSNKEVVKVYELMQHLTIMNSSWSAYNQLGGVGYSNYDAFFFGNNDTDTSSCTFSGPSSTPSTDWNFINLRTFNTNPGPGGVQKFAVEMHGGPNPCDFVDGVTVANDYSNGEGNSGGSGYSIYGTNVNINGLVIEGGTSGADRDGLELIAQGGTVNGLNISGGNAGVYGNVWPAQDVSISNFRIANPYGSWCWEVGGGGVSGPLTSSNITVTNGVCNLTWTGSPTPDNPFGVFMGNQAVNNVKISGVLVILPNSGASGGVRLSTTTGSTSSNIDIDNITVLGQGAGEGIVDSSSDTRDSNLRIRNSHFYNITPFAISLPSTQWDANGNDFSPTWQGFNSQNGYYVNGVQVINAAGGLTAYTQPIASIGGFEKSGGAIAGSCTGGSGTIGSGWTGYCASGATATFTRDNTVYHSGSYSQKLSVSGTYTGTGGISIQTTSSPATVTAGEIVPISLWLRNDGGSITSAGINFETTSGTNLCGQNFYASNLTTTWQQFTFSCTVTAASSSTALTLYTNAGPSISGTIWIDDVAIGLPYTTSIPFTGSSVYYSPLGSGAQLGSTNGGTSGNFISFASDGTMQDSGKSASSFAPASSAGPVTLCSLNTQGSGQTGLTTETNIANCTVPAGTMGANSRLQIWASEGSGSSNTGTCKLYVRWSTTSGSITGVSIGSVSQSSASSIANLLIRFVNANSVSSQVAQFTGLGSSFFTSGGNGSINTSTTTGYLSFNLLDSVSADSCSLQGYSVELWPNG